MKGTLLLGSSAGGLSSQWKTLLLTHTVKGVPLHRFNEKTLLFTHSGSRSSSQTQWRVLLFLHVGEQAASLFVKSLGTHGCITMQTLKERRWGGTGRGGNLSKATYGTSTSARPSPPTPPSIQTLEGTGCSPHPNVCTQSWTSDRNTRTGALGPAG